MGFCSFVGCGPEPQAGIGAACLDSTNSPGDVIRFANFTMNHEEVGGTVLYVEHTAGDDYLSYLTVCKCVGRNAIDNRRSGNGRFSIEFVNFYDNTGADAGSALLSVQGQSGSQLQMAVSNCYFGRNIVEAVYVVSQWERFEFNGCVFSGGEPNPDSIPPGTNNVWRTVTESHPLPQHNTALCPYDSFVPLPTPTGTRSMSRNRGIHLLN
jgi:hypothetical protein